LCQMPAFLNYMCHMSADRKNTKLKLCQMPAFLNYIHCMSADKCLLLILVPNANYPQLPNCLVTRYRDPSLILVPNARKSLLHMYHKSADREKLLFIYVQNVSNHYLHMCNISADTETSLLYLCQMPAITIYTCA